jgi:hypothetical protein
MKTKEEPKEILFFYSSKQKMFSSYVEMLAQACLIMMIWRQLSENLNVNAKFNGTLLLSATVKCAFLFVLPKQKCHKM